MNVLQSINQLLEIVSSHWLLESPSLAQHDKQISLISRENKIGVRKSSEHSQVRVQTLNHIVVIDNTVYLLLVLSLVDFSLLPFVQFNEHFSWFPLLILLLARLLQQPSE